MPEDAVPRHSPAAASQLDAEQEVLGRLGQLTDSQLARVAKQTIEIRVSRVKRALAGAAMHRPREGRMLDR
jgi:hypothetical protein